MTFTKTLFYFYGEKALFYGFLAFFTVFDIFLMVKTLLLA